MKLIAIASVSENDVIGKRGKLPWHLPDDLKRFKTLTENGCVLMGRKTLKSIGHALPNRLNLVITKSDIEFENCHTVSSLQQAVNLALLNDYQTIYIIGGETTFWHTLPRVNTILLTRVHTIVKGDAYFPWHEIEPRKWQLLEAVHHPKDESHIYPFTFLTYERYR